MSTAEIREKLAARVARQHELYEIGPQNQLQLAPADFFALVAEIGAANLAPDLAALHAGATGRRPGEEPTAILLKVTQAEALLNYDYQPESQLAGPAQLDRHETPDV